MLIAIQHDIAGQVLYTPERKRRYRFIRQVSLYLPLLLDSHELSGVSRGIKLLAHQELSNLCCLRLGNTNKVDSLLFGALLSEAKPGGRGGTPNAQSH